MHIYSVQVIEQMTKCACLWFYHEAWFEKMMMNHLERKKEQSLACLTLANYCQKKKSRLDSFISEKSDKSIKVVDKVGAPAVWHKRIVKRAASNYLKGSIAPR